MVIHPAILEAQRYIGKSFFTWEIYNLAEKMEIVKESQYYSAVNSHADFKCHGNSKKMIIKDLQLQ